MSAEDKVKNAAQDVHGKVEEGIGKATGDDQKVAQGKADQMAAGVKKAGEDVKDAFK